jgi:hypothetical protein
MLRRMKRRGNAATGRRNRRAAMLGIAVEKVCDIITRARAFDSQIPLGEDEEKPGEFEADDDVDEDEMLAQAERYKDDPSYLVVV